MPELPEVETVRTGLIPALEGRLLARVETRRKGLRWPFPANMADNMTGARVLRLRRRSKYILIDLDNGMTALIHLGMSGRILIEKAGERDDTATYYDAFTPLEKHDHVVLWTDQDTRIVFNDARRFGAMDLFETATAGDHPLLKPIGPEPLGNAFDEPYLASALAMRNTPIKSALLDQKIVAGLGNIYVCEVLWRAHISPKRKAKSLSAKRVSSLVPIIRDVLSEAIEAGGSSLKDYRQTDGELGYFQHNFAVYDRENQPCRTADCTGNIARIVQSGRSSFYCAKCQR